MESDNFIDNQHFENIIFNERPFSIGEYENCNFIGCDLSNADLTNFIFSYCTFLDSNLSNAKLNQTAFRSCLFSNCKLMGLHFEDCHPFLFEVAFKNCMLDFSSFNLMKIRKINFENSSLVDVDFTSSDLSNAVFNNCNLSKALFNQSNLEKSDFSTSYNYSIDPEINNIHRAKFSIPSVLGLLDKHQIKII